MNQIENVLANANTMDARDTAPESALKKKKIIYRTGIILISLIFLSSGFFEITRNPIVWNLTINLGYPPYFIVFLGIAKIIGVIVLLIPNRLNWLKEWVFVGLIYDATFAFLSHIATAHYADSISPVIAFVLIITTYILFRQINPVLKISF